MSKQLSPTREERLQAALSGTEPAPASDPADGAARAKPQTTASRAAPARQPPAARKP